jgi:hypothetical protein
MFRLQHIAAATYRCFLCIAVDAAATYVVSAATFYQCHRVMSTPQECIAVSTTPFQKVSRLSNLQKKSRPPPPSLPATEQNSESANTRKSSCHRSNEQNSSSSYPPPPPLIWNHTGTLISNNYTQHSSTILLRLLSSPLQFELTRGVTGFTNGAKSG